MLPKKLAKMYPGNNFFLCGGRIFCGTKTDCGWRIAVTAAIAIAGILYYSLMAAYIYEEISKAIVITFTCLYAGLWLTFILCSSTDPGIIPRREYFYIAPNCLRVTQPQRNYF
jgi:hypothetical protein